MKNYNNRWLCISIELWIVWDMDMLDWSMPVRGWILFGRPFTESPLEKLNY